MWYLVKQTPDGFDALSANESRERLEFMLLHRYKRFMPEYHYEIIHSSELLFPELGLALS
jgi:hypothetical protein